MSGSVECSHRRWRSISNLCMIMGGLLGAAFFAKFFSVLALGPVLVALGRSSTTTTLIAGGTSFQTNNSWILGASLFMVALQTLILISGTKATFRWQNYSFIIAMAGTLSRFIVLLIGSQGDFFSHFDALNKSFGGGNVAAVIKGAPGAAAASAQLLERVRPCRRSSRSRVS